MRGKRLALLTVDMPDPTGYGRIVRQGEAVRAIVEHKDASEAQRAIHEVYTGVMAVPTRSLKRWLARLTNDNAQGEYYLTDIVELARSTACRGGGRQGAGHGCRSTASTARSSWPSWSAPSSCARPTR